jgi:pyridoxal phosphate enzyme (YggS family)
VIEPGIADSIASNLEAVRSRIGRAAREAGRDPASVHLVAISKTFSADHIRAAVVAGQREFGENRVQEALPKIEATADLPLRWHLVGHLQSNKARRVVGPFSLVHSVDSLELLKRLDTVAAEHTTPIDVLVQVDVAGEVTKTGLPVEHLESLFGAATSLRMARVVGLMLLPPYFDDPEQARPYFQRLGQLRQDLASRGVPGDMLRELSMGMSHDFEIAIAEGATMVRVGTAIFGQRA